MGNKGRVNSVIHVEKGKETKFIKTNYCRLLTNQGQNKGCESCLHLLLILWQRLPCLTYQDCVGFPLSDGSPTPFSPHYATLIPEIPIITLPQKLKFKKFLLRLKSFLGWAKTFSSVITTSIRKWFLNFFVLEGSEQEQSPENWESPKMTSSVACFPGKK